MLGQVIFCALVTLGFVWWLCWSIYDHIKYPPNGVPLFIKFLFPGFAVFFAGAFTHFMYHDWAHPEEVAARERTQQLAQQRADAPRLIYTKDGCEVYRFRDSGLNHYFTRCPNATTTTVGQHNVTTHHTCGPRGQQCSETHTVQEEIQTGP